MWPLSARDSALPLPDDVPLPDYAEPIASGSFPPLKKNSGQQAGEMIHQFLELRRVANDKQLNKESSDARSNTLARETVATIKVVMGFKITGLAAVQVIQPASAHRAKDYLLLIVTPRDVSKTPFIGIREMVPVRLATDA